MTSVRRRETWARPPVYRGGGPSKRWHGFAARDCVPESRMWRARDLNVERKIPHSPKPRIPIAAETTPTTPTRKSNNPDAADFSSDPTTSLTTLVGVTKSRAAGPAKRQRATGNVVRTLQDREGAGLVTRKCRAANSAPEVRMPQSIGFPRTQRDSCLGLSVLHIMCSTLKPAWRQTCGRTSFFLSGKLTANL